MQWLVTSGDILDQRADALVFSGNVLLNLSGGVGGAFLLRHGEALQTFLLQWKRDRQLKGAMRGQIVVCPPCGSSFKRVLHVVAVDGAYRATVSSVGEVVADAIGVCSAFGDSTVVMSAMATGYGPLRIADFAEAVRPLIDRSWSEIETITLCMRHDYEADELRRILFAPGNAADSGRH